MQTAENLGAHIATEPQAIESAHSLIAGWVRYGIHDTNEVEPRRMPNPQLVKIAGLTRDAILDGAQGMHEIISAKFMNDADMRSAFVTCTEAPPAHPNHARQTMEAILRHDATKRRQFLVWEIQKRLDAGQDTARLEAQLAGLADDAVASISSTIDARRFDMSSMPEKPIALLSIDNHALLTPGNIMNIQALPKAGKSATLESIIAAVLNGNRQGPDTFGFSSDNPQGHAVIHLDTEQSRFDHDALIRRALRRAMVDQTPPWLMSYSIADLDVAERLQALRHLLKQARKSFGGIHSILIDGVADLVLDPNDSAESFALVGELHSSAIRYHAGVITVLHENPGSETAKTRGHLGSQLERKAECNLRLAKDSAGITTIWAERARHCHLPKDQGKCFAWNAQASMHTACGTAGEMKSAANREKSMGEADSAFGGRDGMRHSDLVAATGDALDLKERAAKKRIQTWMAEGIITKDSSGNYHLSNP